MSSRKKATTQDSTVILLFQDEDKKFLASPQIISGKRHEPIKFRFKDFEGYNLIQVDGFTSDFVLPYAAITFTYRKKMLVIFGSFVKISMIAVFYKNQLLLKEKSGMSFLFHHLRSATTLSYGLVV